MSIWILAFVLCALLGVIGFFSGAIRTALLWLGVVVASAFTGGLAPKLTTLMPKIGIKHPLWIQVTPYIIVFALIALAVYGIGFAVHHKIANIYKFQRDDFSRIKWQRMNAHVGLSLGLVIAVMLLFAISRVAYAGGYLTTQVAEETKNPPWIKFLNAARTDMQSTGLDKAVAALDKTPPAYYDAADIVGLIYHNPALQSRLANYPPFLSLGQRPEFQEVASDKEYNDLIFGKSSFGAIINHPNSQRFLGNQEILAEFRAVDLKDLRQYLETGKSKYDDEKILGRWILDKDGALTHVRKTRPDIKGAELVAIKKGLEALPDITLIATLDNKTIIKAEGAPAGGEGQPAEGGEAPPPQDPTVPDRYRQFMQPQQPQPTRPAQRPATPPPVLRLAGEGEWKSAPAGGYEITVQDGSGKAQVLTAFIEEDEMTVSRGNLALVFLRAQ